MKLKLRCVKPVAFTNATTTTSYYPDEIAYARINDNGDMYLTRNNSELYWGPYNPSDIGRYFVSEFDEDEYRKHCRVAYNAKIYVDDTMIASCNHVVYFE